MSHAGSIIAKFGGASSLARTLGHRHATTVQSWKKSGVIPAKRQQGVLDAAKRLGIDLSPADFFEAGETVSDRSEERAA